MVQPQQQQQPGSCLKAAVGYDNRGSCQLQRGGCCSLLRSHQFICLSYLLALSALAGSDHSNIWESARRLVVAMPAPSKHTAQSKKQAPPKESSHAAQLMALMLQRGGSASMSEIGKLACGDAPAKPAIVAGGGCATATASLGAKQEAVECTAASRSPPPRSSKHGRLRDRKVPFKGTAASDVGPPPPPVSSSTPPALQPAVEPALGAQSPPGSPAWAAGNHTRPQPTAAKGPPPVPPSSMSMSLLMRLVHEASAGTASLDQVAQAVRMMQSDVGSLGSAGLQCPSTSYIVVYQMLLCHVSSWRVVVVWLRQSTPHVFSP